MRHDDCPRATMVETWPGPGRVWRCCKCRKQLATMELGPIVLDPALIPLDVKHDGLPAYGVPRRVLSGKHGDAAGSAVVLPQAKLGIYVYCPRVRRGEEHCGTGQHLGD